MTERVQVEPSDIKVGDLIEVDEKFDSGDWVTYHGVVVKSTATYVGTADLGFTVGEGLGLKYTFYRLPKPAPQEPKGLGAVVKDNEGDLWVRTPNDMWVTRSEEYDLDSDGTWDEIVRDYGPIEVVSDGYTA